MGKFNIRFDFNTGKWKVVETRKGLTYAVHFESEDIAQAKLKLEELK